MKSRHLIFLPLFLLGLLLPSCGSSITPSSSDEVSSEAPSETTSEVSSEESSEPSSEVSSEISSEALVLPAPVLTLNDDNDGLAWAPIDNAIGYEVKVNDGAFATATDYSFAHTEGSYSVVVKAIGDGIDYLDSAASVPFAYDSFAVTLSDLSREAMTVSWTAVAYQTEVKFNEGAYVATSGTSYVATGSGLVSVRASGGYDETGHDFYFGDAIVKERHVVKVAEFDYVIEDVETSSNTELQEEWLSSKYSGGAWVSTTGVASVSYETPGGDNTQSLKLDVWKNGDVFRYGKVFELTESYNALTILTKGDDDIDYTLRLNDTESGVYADYKIDDAPTNWVYHLVRFDDPAWAVSYGGSTYNLTEVATAMGYLSGGELVTVFDTFQIIVKGTYTDGGPKTYALADDIAFVNTSEEASSHETHVDVQGRYTGKLGDTIYYMEVSGAAATVKTLNLETNVNIPATVTIDDDIVNIKSNDEGAALNYTGRLSFGGDRITYISCTGTYAAALATLNMSRVKVLDDFDDYAETGIGYDQNNAADARTGLRAEYYSDYYSGNSGSPLGGSGWSLMGSSDYLNLKVDDGHSATQSARMKRSGSAGAMRFISYPLYTGVNPGFGSGNDTFSFWAKGDTFDTSTKVRVYYISKVEASTQTTTESASATILIPGGSDWTQYTVAINPAKTVFGFSFTLEVNWSHTVNGYIHVDDIELFSGNPWATYVAPAIAATNVTVNPETLSLHVGGSHTITATVEPTEATNKNVTWSSDTPAVATVNADGKISAISEGSATITATTDDGSFTDTCAVTVSAPVVLESGNGTTTEALQTKYLIQYGDSWQTSSSTDRIEYRTASPAPYEGDGCVALKNGTFGKMRYKSADMSVSLGTFTGFSMWFYNDTGASISAQMFVYEVGGANYLNFATFSIPSNSTWTQYTCMLGNNLMKQVAGYSIILPVAAATGHPCIDNVTIF